MLYSLAETFSPISGGTSSVAMDDELNRRMDNGTIFASCLFAHISLHHPPKVLRRVGGWTPLLMLPADTKQAFQLFRAVNITMVIPWKLQLQRH
jgi:hypothetical protein